MKYYDHHVILIYFDMFLLIIKYNEMIQYSSKHVYLLQKLTRRCDMWYKSLNDTYESYFDHNFNILILYIMIDFDIFWHVFVNKTQSNDTIFIQTCLVTLKISKKHVICDIKPLIDTYGSHFDHNFNILILHINFDIFWHVFVNKTQ